MLIDEYLIRCAQNGDKEALSKLIGRYYDKIYTYCYHHTSDIQSAEDLCQDTFYSMLKHIEEYRHYSKFQNYLYIIAGNKCKDYYKKKKPIYLDEIPENITKTDGFETDYEMKELVNMLPKELKEVIILRFYQESKFQDIANILQISNSLVKYRVKKAISFLQEEMERSGS